VFSNWERGNRSKGDLKAMLCSRKLLCVHILPKSIDIDEALYRQRQGRSVTTTSNIFSDSRPMCHHSSRLLSV
jgi:hypothetical protein